MVRGKRSVGALSWAMGTALAITLLLPMAASSAPASRIGTWYLFGTNMPWFNWAQDFGGGPTGGGVSGNIRGTTRAVCVEASGPQHRADSASGVMTGCD